MARYVILRDRGGSPLKRRPTILAVRDGFSILAFVISPLWLLWHRLWFAAMLVVAASVGLALIALEPRFAWIVLPANFTLSILVGFEGQGWRIAKASGQGYQPVDVVDAASREEAELRFADPYFSANPATGPATPPPSPAQRPVIPYVFFDVPAGAPR